MTPQCSGQPKEMCEGRKLAMDYHISTSSGGNNNYDSCSEGGIALMVYA